MHLLTPTNQTGLKRKLFKWKDKVVQLKQVCPEGTYKFLLSSKSSLFDVIKEAYLPQSQCGTAVYLLKCREEWSWSHLAIRCDHLHVVNFIGGQQRRPLLFGWHCSNTIVQQQTSMLPCIGNSFPWVLSSSLSIMQPEQCNQSRDQSKRKDGPLL